MTDHADVLISGGTIVDGTGAAGFAGSVAITADRLSVLPPGAEAPAATRVIDATGKIVGPGFIDLHSHAGLMILADPRHEPKVRQGVTTEIIGVDGLSYTPLPSRQDLAELVEMNAGLDGAPDITYDWD
ncbi:MAG TPA: amidohydrolase family protein, partial [Candidatus Limnocylindria bacterium]|nr:amidohydrolase family protein [Candidatus Limnocylindria bacterium]